MYEQVKKIVSAFWFVNGLYCIFIPLTLHSEFPSMVVKLTDAKTVEHNTILHYT